MSNPQEFATDPAAKNAIAQTIAESVGVPRDRVIVSIEVAGRRLQASSASIIRANYEIRVPQNTTVSQITDSMQSATGSGNLGTFTDRLSQNLVSQGASQDISSSVNVLSVTPLVTVTTTSTTAASQDTTAGTTAGASSQAATQVASDGLSPSVIGAIVGSCLGAMVLLSLGGYCWFAPKAAANSRVDKESTGWTPGDPTIPPTTLTPTGSASKTEACDNNGENP